MLTCCRSMAWRMIAACRKEVAVGAGSSGPPWILRSHLQNSRCSRLLCMGGPAWGGPEGPCASCGMGVPIQGGDAWCSWGLAGVPRIG